MSGIGRCQNQGLICLEHYFLSQNELCITHQKPVDISKIQSLVLFWFDKDAKKLIYYCRIMNERVTENGYQYLNEDKKFAVIQTCLSFIKTSKNKYNDTK